MYLSKTCSNKNKTDICKDTIYPHICAHLVYVILSFLSRYIAIQH